MTDSPFIRSEGFAHLPFSYSLTLASFRWQPNRTLCLTQVELAGTEYETKTLWSPAARTFSISSTAAVSGHSSVNGGSDEAIAARERRSSDCWNYLEHHLDHPVTDVYPEANLAVVDRALHRRVGEEDLSRRATTPRTAVRTAEVAG